MNTSAKPANETWQEIQCAVESLSARARDDVSPQIFYGELVHSLTQLTSAKYCKIWCCEATAPAESTEVAAPAADVWTVIRSSQDNAPTQGFKADTLTAADYAQLVAKAASSPTETFLDTGATLPHDPRIRIPYDTLLQRVKVGDDVAAVIELAHEHDRSPSQREGAKHMATVASEVASDFQRNWQLRQFRDREARREKLDRFLDRVHQTYDLRRVAYAIVAEGKELIDCDRVSLVLKQGRNCRVIAVSGVQKPDRRSPTVQTIERLAKSNIREIDPIWAATSPSDSDNPALAKYFDVSNAKQVGLLPLMATADAKRQPERIGTILVEVFDDDTDVDSGLLASRANWMVRHSSNAISNAVNVDRLPLLSVNRWLDRNVTRGRRIPWMALLSLLILAAIWYVAWLPTDFRIDARGELVPTKRESIYAPRSGTVVEFPLIEQSVKAITFKESADPQDEPGDRVSHRDRDKQGTPVKAGDTVVRMENADLDYELTTLLGEQSTIGQQLETITKSIGQFGGARDAESRSRYDELTTQAAELKVKQESIARRIRLVNKEQQRLNVKANIAGRILTWDVVNSLKLRPVQQGDLLLEVVDLDGPWEIELYVRDRHIGYVKRAQKNGSSPLSISFYHRSDPEQEYKASIRSMSMSTEVYPEYGSAVRIIGEIDSASQPADMRPGTTIFAKIDCGKKPLAYVLGYDLIHTLRMWMLF